MEEGFIEDPNPQEGLLTCSHCGGGLHLIELYLMNSADPDRAMTYFQPHKDGLELSGILDGEECSTYPGEEEPGCVFALECSQCRRSTYLDIRFERRDGRTRFYRKAAVPHSDDEAAGEIPFTKLN